jgi:hypothetical protein
MLRIGYSEIRRLKACSRSKYGIVSGACQAAPNSAEKPGKHSF